MEKFVDPKEKIHKNTFSISLYNCSIEAANKYYSSFSGNYNIYDSANIMARNNIRCIEVEKYFDIYYKKFINKFDYYLKNPPDWFEIVPDEEERIVSLEKEILEEEVFCSSEYNIGHLLPLKKETNFDWSFVDKYGWEFLDTLSSNFYRPNKIQQISSDNYQRSSAEKAHSFNLAIKGNNIPLERILESLTIAKLEEIVKDIPHKKFKKKAEYISFITSLPDFKTKVNNIYPIEDFFVFLPLTDEMVNAGLFNAIKYWNCCVEATSFLFDLYCSKERPPKLVFYNKKIESKKSQSASEKNWLFKKVFSLFNKA